MGALTRRFAFALAGVVALLALLAPVASAHVVPTSSIRLTTGETSIGATVSIPLDDLESALGVDLGEEAQADVDAQAGAITAYLLAHFTPTGDDGTAWAVTAGSLVVGSTGDSATTGVYQQLTTTFTLTPADGGSLTSFDLGYDAVVEQVATHSIIVTAVSADGEVSALGTIARNTVTNTVETLHVDGAGGGSSGFSGMLRLGMQHIQEGTDHQLFLLTLLLPAPLLARGRRWAEAVPARSALRRITSITLAFTLGHSVTLALGALGVPVPQQLVEALIAVSILVAAVHAVRPLFPGKEALVAAGFGLIHGLAFSEALRDLDLTGQELVLALLGFNLGIEAMQLIVVALVLPPLLLLAHAGRYQRLRVVSAALTGVAATGWLADRLGVPNAVAAGADRLGTVAVPVVVGLWLAALVVTAADRRQVPRTAAAPTI